MNMRQQPLNGHPPLATQISVLDDDLRFQRGMWCKVITLALRDAANQTTGCVEAMIARAKARLWLFSTTFAEDLAEVCDLAGLTPQYVRRQAAQVLAQGLRFSNQRQGAGFHFTSKTVHAAMKGA